MYGEEVVVSVGKRLTQSSAITSVSCVRLRPNHYCTAPFKPGVVYRLRRNSTVKWSPSSGDLDKLIRDINSKVSQLDDAQMKEVCTFLKLGEGPSGSLEGRDKLALKRLILRYVNGEELEATADGGLAIFQRLASHLEGYQQRRRGGEASSMGAPTAGPDSAPTVD